MIANGGFHRIKKGGRNGFLLKSRLQRGLDSANWSCIEELMMYMGFGEKWISSVHECILGSQLEIFINGSPEPRTSASMWFTPIKEGDPLSSLLFDIAVEGLSVPLLSGH
ncbi:hypothetical protein OIU74_002984 [Salix koriyanagi]|uniref:Uncharacterized protein n=1 Tax=Salix koriyanagi TaxID=2511006 RepID=A0A9Q0UXN9_9ROSI|nr:hypothetical protein OIU74_002984 [Salix koriyanagi]